MESGRGVFQLKQRILYAGWGADARVRNSLLRGCCGREHQQHRVERKHEKRKEVSCCRGKRMFLWREVEDVPVAEDLGRVESVLGLAAPLFVRTFGWLCAPPTTTASLTAQLRDPAQIISQPRVS